MSLSQTLRGFAPASPLSLSPRLLSGLLGVVEFLLVFGIGMAIYAVYVEPTDDILARYLTACLIAAVLFVQSFANVGLYRFESVVEPRNALGRVARVCALLFVALITCAFFLKVSDGFSRVWAVSWCALTAGALCAARVGFAHIVRRTAQTGRVRRNVVVVGAGPQAARLLEALSMNAQPWNRVVAVFDDRRTRGAMEVAGRPVDGDLDDLLQYARQARIDELVVALPWSAAVRIRAIIERLQPLPVRIRLSPDFAGFEFSKARYGRHLGVPLLDICDKPIDGWSYLLKNMFDRFAAAALVLLLSPLLGVIALAVKLSSAGPVFFHQARYGYNQRLIQMVKFRTMYTHSQDDKAETLVTRDDPRVTPLGNFLRRTSLDELPQLLNVLRGEMSLVGPRPHALEAKAAGKLYEEAVTNYTWRHKVKPGITGWAQVNGWRGETDTEDKILKRVEHDLHYINNWSLSLDFIILLRTAWTVVFGRNAY